MQACADLVAKADPDRYLSVLAAPLAARRVLLPIYAFNIEVARAPWVTAEPMIAEMRLQWWRDALDEIAKGGPVRRHEVLDELTPVIDAEGALVLDRLVAARRWDIHRGPFDDAAHFDDYLAKTSGGLMWTAARALGATDPAPVADVARAAGLASWFQAVPELMARSCQPLIDPGEDAIRALATEGLARLKSARGLQHLVPAAARPALRAGWRAGAVLKAAKADPGLVLQGGLAESEARRRAGLLWLSFRGGY